MSNVELEGKTLKEQREAVILIIDQLEEERKAIYDDGHVDGQEHPRLVQITHDLRHYWDLRHRIEATISNGLSAIPVPPPADPDDLTE